MNRYQDDDWTERNFDAVKPGATVQHSTTMRYGQVVGWPDHELVCVKLAHRVRETWKLEDLTWRRTTMAVAIFNTGK